MYIHIFYPPPLIKIPQPFVDTPRRNQWLAYAGIMTRLSYVVSFWMGLLPGQSAKPTVKSDEGGDAGTQVQFTDTDEDVPWPSHHRSGILL